jgi:DNA-binding NarL/FixJ family response regulator
MDKYRVVIIDDHDLLRRGFISALGENWMVTYAGYLRFLFRQL